MLRPVRKQSLSDSVFIQLRDQIVSGELAVGEQLPGERGLAEALGVNRGAVREALKRLEQAGLVSIQHGGGTRVLDFRASAAMDLVVQIFVTPEGNLNLSVARSVVELSAGIVPHMARLAARRASPEIVKELRARVAEMGKLGRSPEELARLQSLRWEFWWLQMEASRNLAYQLAFNMIRDIYGRAKLFLRGVLQPVLGDTQGFEKIAAAIANHDEDAAEAAARGLLEPATDVLAALINEAEAEGRSIPLPQDPE